MNKSGWLPPSYSVRQAISPEHGNNAQAPRPIAVDLPGGVMVARAIVAKQRQALDACRTPPAYSVDVLADVELQFVWGIFSELVARLPDGGGPPRDVVALHVMYYLVSDRGLDPAAARAEAMKLEDLHDRAETLFEMIAARGRLAYLGEGSVALCRNIEGPARWH